MPPSERPPRHETLGLRGMRSALPGEVTVSIATAAPGQRATTGFIRGATARGDLVTTTGDGAVARRGGKVAADTQAAGRTGAAQQRPFLALAVVVEDADAVFAAAAAFD